MRRSTPICVGSLALAIGSGIVIACSSDPSGAPPPAGEAGTDAPLLGETGPPVPDAEPPLGDPCGDARGLSDAAPWPLRGGCPKRGGRASAPGPTSPSVTLLQALSSAETSPAIDGEHLAWFGTPNGDVFAVNATGFVQSAHHVGGPVTSSPAIAASGAIVLGGGDGVLYGLSRSGSTTTFDAGPEAGGSPIPESRVVFQIAVGPFGASSPVIGADGTIYVGTTGGDLVAVAFDGSAIKWRTPTHDTFGSSPAIGGDGTIYVGSTDAHLYAIGPGGAVKWALPTSGEVHGSPAIGGDDAIFVGTEDGTLHAVSPDGTSRWTYKAGGAIHGTPGVARAAVYAPSADKQLHAVDITSGKLLWLYPTLGEVGTPVIGTDGSIYFGSADAHVYSVSPGGTLLWALNAKGRVRGAPALADGLLFYTTDTSIVAVGP
jgi:outer membrane protein assembly factor BamB